MGFNNYRRHVRSKHPEISFKEQVKCGKCGLKVFKSAYKYHRQIFHKSGKVKSTPACDYVPRPPLVNFSSFEVKVELSEIKVIENEQYIDPGTTSEVDHESENHANKSKNSMEGNGLKGDLSE